MSVLSRTILAVTAVSGTLNILSAFAFAGMAGVTPGQILRYVASGPFGDGMSQGGAGAAVLGLCVHYALMAAMAAVFALAAQRMPALTRQPVLAGALYGVLIYLVMYGLVVPARFGPTHLPKLDTWHLGNALFSHIICVGIPMAFVTARMLRGRGVMA